jgi:uncharacterized protein (DUF2141 family)
MGIVRMLDRFIGVFFGLTVLLGAGVTAAEPGTELRLEIEGLEQASGSIYISVYDSDDDWLGKDTVMRKQVLIAEARLEGLVHVDMALPPGDYAITMYYDRNNNGEMDTNFIGIPKEPVALSNNAKARFGPPKYKDAVFTLGTEAVVQRIAINAID